MAGALPNLRRYGRTRRDGRLTLYRNRQGNSRMDRTEASRELARVFAYLAVGNTDKARTAAGRLIEWLQAI